MRGARQGYIEVQGKLRGRYTYSREKATHDNLLISVNASLNLTLGGGTLRSLSHQVIVKVRLGAEPGLAPVKWHPSNCLKRQPRQITSLEYFHPPQETEH